MGRLRRFEEHRFVGDRSTMTVFDCDDEAAFAALSARVDGDGLFDRNLLQTFGPDTIEEARNRSFRLHRPKRSDKRSAASSGSE